MPWLHTTKRNLPCKDLVSFSFDSPTYDIDKPIYHDLDDPSRTLSHRQGKAIVRKLVAGFRAAGLKKGDCFSITSFNDIMYPMVFLGGVGAGGIFSGTNPAYKKFEIIHHIRTAEVKFFIVEPELLDLVWSCARECGVGDERIFVFDVRGGDVPRELRSWSWLLEQGESDWDRIIDRETLENTEVARLTTSGTTGLPKTAKQSHFNATSFHDMTVGMNNAPWESRNLYPLPMFHVATVPAVHASPFKSGNKCWIMRRFELEKYLEAVQRLGITDLGMVPPLVIAILGSELRKKYSLKSVRRVGAGAAPLDAVSQRRFQDLCHPEATFTQVMGMTETTGAVCLFYWPESDETGSVGSCFMPETDVKLIDGEGRDVTDYDVEGELCIRGPTVIKGYFNNEKANRESYDGEGYFKTGDIMFCSSKNKLWYIVDRKKELVKVRGFQVAPPELEGFLLRDERIVDCAVIGLKALPGSDAERPRAYVVKRAGARITEEEVKGLIRENLASYKALTGGVVFVDEVPKSASGKILKRILREEAEKEEMVMAKL